MVDKGLLMDVVSGFARAADGTDLYWRAVGSGPPIVCCNGVGVSTFFFKYITRHFRDRFTVVLWDYRGHGQSSPIEDPLNADLSMGLVAEDMHAILESAGVSEPAILIGHSMGVQVILEFTKRYPERVRALVPMFGTFARPMDTFLDSPMSKPIFDTLAKVTKWTGSTGAWLLHPLYASPVAIPFGRRAGLMDRYYASNRDIQMYMDHLVEMDPAVFLRMVECLSEHDLEDFLCEVHVPVLIFAGEKDLFTPLHRSYRMADLIPDSELVVLPEGSHAAIVEYPDTINQRLDRFIDQKLGGAANLASKAESTRAG
ncbi:MAG: pimeloyl-ACP methyl ester carboxylesterase [Myxococcota bacterium]|jgi:pimeloyl-ACP methyl ester carboxylesterase